MRKKAPVNTGISAKFSRYYDLPKYSSQMYSGSGGGIDVDDNDIIFYVKNYLNNIVKMTSKNGQLIVNNYGGGVITMSTPINIVSGQGINANGVVSPGNTITITNTEFGKIKGKPVDSPTASDNNKFLKYSTEDGGKFVLDNVTSETSSNATSIGGQPLPSIPTTEGSYFLTYQVPSGQSVGTFSYLNIDQLATTIANSIQTKIPRYKKEDFDITNAMIDASGNATIDLPHKVTEDTEMVYLNGQLMDLNNDYQLDDTNPSFTKIKVLKNSFITLNGVRLSMTYIY